MIIVELLGGLGNQLFQYAAGRATALRLGTSLALDTRFLDQDRKRAFALGAFRVRATTFNGWQRPPWRIDGEWWPWLRLVAAERLGQPLPMARFKEDDSAGTFDGSSLQLGRSTVMSGYFQSERYFAEFATVLKHELTLASSPSPSFQQAAIAISAAGPNSVSLHIRRGDYATDPTTAAVHGLVGCDYYSRALAALATQIVRPSIFLFTDDLRALAEIEALDLRPHVLSGLGLTDAEEMMLMAACRHHVIANSSFSWWGAWLGQHGGTTVAPGRWFAKESAASIKDRFPSAWLVV